MNLLLNTYFFKAILSKVFEKTIRKKAGCNVDFVLDELTMEHKDGDKIYVDLHVGASMTQEELEKLLKKLNII